MNKKHIIIISSILGFILLAFILLGFIFVPKILTDDDALDVSTWYGDEYVIPSGKVYMLGNLIGTADVEGEVDINKVGVYTLTYTYKNGILKSTYVKHVKVEDVLPPTIELVGENPSYVCPNKEYVEEGYKGYDDYDGELTDKIELVKDLDSILYKLDDSSNNHFEVKRELIYLDKKAPDITLTGGDQTIYLNNTFKDPGYTAVDNCDGDVTSKVTVTGDVNTSKLGTYYKTYKVTDSSGNVGEVKRKIVVTSRPSSGTYISGGSPGVIYLTFDDGPSGTTTPKILDILKKYNVKATFFVIGSGPDAMIKREYDEGHAIGLHSYTHNWGSVYGSVDSFWNDMNRVSDRIYRITGYRTDIMRFPGGSSNTVSKRYTRGIMSFLVKDVIDKGYQYFDWNVDSNDAGGTTDPNEEYNNIIRGLSKNRGNIVLMHDIKPSTANCIERVIQYGLANGYKFEVLTKNTTPSHHRVNN